MKNLYTLEVCKNGYGNPVTVVTINSSLMTGFHFFRSPKIANAWISEAKADLAKVGENLEYDADGESLTPDLAKLIRDTLIDMDYCLTEIDEKPVIEQAIRYIVTITDPTTRQTSRKYFWSEYIATRFRAECVRNGKPAKILWQLVEIQL